VFTSGAFDILHAGHVRLLQAAAQLIPWPHTLVVGVNSDESIRKYKPHKIINRPILPLQHRMDVVAALGCVTYVFPFDEPNNRKNIRALRPTFYVKGGDRTKEELTSTSLVERYGGEVVIVPIEENVSTSQIVTTIIDRVDELPNLKKVSRETGSV
jgi:D-beta-D-heptose 7-phosphate kinase/D-beta-D-heptose 1-phosphate adenosyltransferase